MMRRALTLVVLLAMVAFGVGVYARLASLKTRGVVAASPNAPGAARVSPKFRLPGTMFLAQGGSIYKLQDGLFRQIATGNWTQPVLSPDHSHLVAVARFADTSDLYLLDLNGQILKQLTHNASRVVDFNHWSFYPRFSPDGQTLFYSWDPKNPDNLYRVDLVVYAMPLAGPQSRARAWTEPYFWTGGDVQPVPLRSGGLLYTKFDISEQTNQPNSRIWLTTRPGAAGKALTTAEENCAQPALSPDETMLAMICTAGGQTGRLVVAPFNGTTLGLARTLVEGQLCAAPAWSPEGTGLAYFAATGASGHFQLFYLALPPALSASPSPFAVASSSPKVGATASARPTPSPAPLVPIQVSYDLDFDATAAPAWSATFP
jgi:Tol biopolymer transport system component